MNAPLPINLLINVQVNLTPAGASFASIASAMVLGSSNVIDTTERIRIYNSLPEVEADFGTTAPEALSATLWFGQSPSPDSFVIGRWAQTATAGLLVGGGLTAANLLLSAWTGITAGGFLATINGVPYAISGLDFAADLSLNGVANTIGVALNSAESGAGCSYFSAYELFQFFSGTTGVGSTFGFIQPSTAVGTVAFAGQPTATHTLTIDGTSVEFVSSSPTGNEVLIGASLPATLANLLTFLNASTDTNIVKMTYAVVGNNLYCISVATGTAGNAYTLATTDSNITVPSTLSGGVAADISAMLAATNTAGNGAYVAPGVAAESAVAAVTLLDSQFGSQWYGLVVPQAVDADHLAIAAYIEGVKPNHFYGVNTQEAGVLSAVSTSDIAYLMSALKYTHSAVQYSSTSAYAVISMLARILTTDWEAQNSTITLMYKQEPGVVADTINGNQLAALLAKNCNVYTNYGNTTSPTPIIQPGTTCTTTLFIDTVIGLDWLANQIQIDVFNVLFTAITKVPQTDPGEHLIYMGIQSACAAGANNGLIGPGQWNAGGFGQITQGSYLPLGYYIYQPSTASQNQTLRAARVSVAFQVAVKLAGAVHTATISVSVNQ